MKAPLRFAFGWVLYLAILMATNPVVAYLWLVVWEQPLVVTVGTSVFGVVFFILLYFRVLRPFFGWCDAHQERAVSNFKVVDVEKVDA
ncbi:hypothetical protein [Stutzerimonas nitrititolerans]|uniref:hypothetical protein n=1 Tax=Stutzerimonas nitrititolerans TaxID=2482751 RepID=UPI00289D8AA0|nr:hypothetical protein [Stutzerimonas nitrititolerans]